MLLFQYAIVGFFLSVLGSIPLGLITITNMERTVHRGTWSGIVVALGATVAEFLYTFIALKFLSYFLEQVQISQSINIFSVFVFLGLGIFYFFRTAGTSISGKSPLMRHHYQDFFKGVIIGFMNMLIIPFWIFIGAMLETHNMYFASDRLILVFSAGAALGALAIFLLYVKLVKLIAKKIKQVVHYTNRVVGVLFFALTLFQLIRLLG